MASDQTSTTPLSGDAQAIKDGFDHLGGSTDPRSGFGRIPQSSPPDSKGDLNTGVDTPDAGSAAKPQPVAVFPSGPTNASPTSEPSSNPVITTPNPAIPLTPGGQAIKDGFDHLGTAGDPRTGLGKIPTPPDSIPPTNHPTSPSATQPVDAVPTSDSKSEPSVAVDPKTAPLTPDGQAIKDGFDHLGTAHDPRKGLGKIPPPPSSGVATDSSVQPQPLSDATW